MAELPSGRLKARTRPPALEVMLGFVEAKGFRSLRESRATSGKEFISFDLLAKPDVLVELPLRERRLKLIVAAALKEDSVALSKGLEGESRKGESRISVGSVGSWRGASSSWEGDEERASMSLLILLELRRGCCRLSKAVVERKL